eukprot:Rmarinus@m.18205
MSAQKNGCGRNGAPGPQTYQRRVNWANKTMRNLTKKMHNCRVQDIVAAVVLIHPGGEVRTAVSHSEILEEVRSCSSVLLGFAHENGLALKSERSGGGGAANAQECGDTTVAPSTVPPNAVPPNASSPNTVSPNTAPEDCVTSENDVRTILRLIGKSNTAILLGAWRKLACPDVVFSTRGNEQPRPEDWPTNVFWPTTDVHALPVEKVHAFGTYLNSQLDIRRLPDLVDTELPLKDSLKYIIEELKGHIKLVAAGFTTKRRDRCHVDERHQFKCPKCSLGFLYQRSLTTHLRKVHMTYRTRRKQQTDNSDSDLPETVAASIPVEVAPNVQSGAFTSDPKPLGAVSGGQFVVSTAGSDAKPLGTSAGQLVVGSDAKPPGAASNAQVKALAPLQIVAVGKQPEGASVTSGSDSNPLGETSDAQLGTSTPESVLNPLRTASGAQAKALAPLPTVVVGGELLEGASATSESDSNRLGSASDAQSRTYTSGSVSNPLGAAFDAQSLGIGATGPVPSAAHDPSGRKRPARSSNEPVEGCEIQQPSWQCRKPRRLGV